MVPTPALAAAAASLLFSIPASAAMYSQKSPVLSIDFQSYETLIAQSNHTSIVEFYAPWCGHCQNLKPVYEKVAASLKGLAKVAAVNCDDAFNKDFCGRMGVTGFPTLKIVKPGKKPGKPIVTDYAGHRSSNEMTNAVVEKISNHVKRVQDKDIDAWLAESNGTAKALLFSDKSSVSALYKALAIDFLGSITFGQIKNTNTEAVEMFGVKQFPDLILLPGGDKDGLVYEGELNKPSMLEFLSQAAVPNPDPDPAKVKAKKPKKESKAKPASSSTSSSSADAAASPAVEEDAAPAEQTPPSPPNPGILILMLESKENLQDQCLSQHSHTCVLALIPKKEHDEPLTAAGKQAIKSMGEIQSKLAKHGGSATMRFWSVPYSNELGPELRKKGNDVVEIVAINAKKQWVKRFNDKEGYGIVPVEEWVDAIRMGEGKKESLPKKIKAALIEGSAEKIMDIPQVMMEGGGDLDIEGLMEDERKRGPFINKEDILNSPEGSNFEDGSGIKIQKVKELHSEEEIEELKRKLQAETNEDKDEL